MKSGKKCAWISFKKIKLENFDKRKKLVQLLKKRKDDEARICFLKIKAENFGRRKKLVQGFFFWCKEKIMKFG